MADPTVVNAQIVDSLTTTQGATMVQPVIKTSGAGKAYQSVAQSTAIAIQDATDNLRNLGTISTTAIGVAMSQYLATGESKYADAVKSAQQIVTQAAVDFKTIGKSAAEILKEFPAG